MRRYPLCKEIHDQDTASDEKDSTLRVHIIAFAALYLACYSSGKVAHPLGTQLFREVFLEWL